MSSLFDKYAKQSLLEAEQRKKKELEQFSKQSADHTTSSPKEINGPQGPEPTRYGDWEKKGIVTDF